VAVWDHSTYRSANP